MCLVELCNPDRLSSEHVVQRKVCNPINIYKDFHILVTVCIKNTEKRLDVSIFVFYKCVYSKVIDVVKVIRYNSNRLGANFKTTYLLVSVYYLLSQLRSAVIFHIICKETTKFFRSFLMEQKKTLFYKN